MAIQTTFADLLPYLDSSHHTATTPGAGARRGLLARCGDWLRHRSDAAYLREMEPHLARDIGAAPGCGPCPEGFAADPRPLWGIGLTPQPMDTRSPRAERCRG